MKKKSETFNLQKFVSGLSLTSQVGWAKTAALSFRMVIVAGLIAAGTFGYGYWRGLKNRPVQVDLHNAHIVLKNGDGKTHDLIIKDGQMIFDGRPVKVGDLPQLKPYGIGLKPKLAAGITTSGNPAVGLALEVARVWNWNLDILALYKFLGIGVSYDLHFEKPIFVDNTSIGLGIGRDFDTNATEAILYVTINF